MTIGLPRAGWWGHCGARHRRNENPQGQTPVARRGAVGAGQGHEVTRCSAPQSSCSRWRWFSHMGIGPTGLIAGKPAPTGKPGVHETLCLLKIQRGSDLARDGGGSVNEDVECAGLFAGKPAPTGKPGVHETLCLLKIQCGSELARDGGGSVTGMLGLQASSRAGSLPQEERGHPEPGRLSGRLVEDVDLEAPR